MIRPGLNALKGSFVQRSLVASVLLLAVGFPGLAGAAELSFTAKQNAAAGASAVGVTVFWLLGGLTLFGAVMTITRRHPVTAALFLVLTLFSTGGLFLVLNATFLAAIQVLVYAGAVMVLFMFVVMAVARGDAEEIGLTRGLFPKVLGLIAIGVFADRLLRVFLAQPASLPGVVPDGFGDVRSIGRLLFSTYLLPFEALSLLLLVAIVGAVMITRRPGQSSAAHGASVELTSRREPKGL